MPIRREFVDWSAPALPAVVERLIEEYTILDKCDLSNVIAVFPAARAGRRFLELLAEKTGGRNEPPEVVTVGRLPEKLYEPKRPFANPLTQQLAWVEALRSTPQERMSRLVSQVPDDHDVDSWMSLGRLLSDQHTELAADRLDFGLVAERGKELSGFDEAERWSVLREVQTAYLATLDRLELWDIQTARLVAIERKECHTARQILLIGAVDLNQAMRAMLDQVADRVTVFIHAPKSHQKLFDSHGCLIPERWEEKPIEVRREQIRVVDRPIDQAEATARTLAEFRGAWRIDEISIGMGDESIVPLFERRMAEYGIPAAWATARTLDRTGPFLLLEAVAAYLEDASRVDRFASLIRHPDVTDWINHQGLEPGWLACVDGYLARHLQKRLGNWLDDRPETELVRRVDDQVKAVTAPLKIETRVLSQWTEPLVTLLLAIYNHREFDREVVADRHVLEAIKTIHEALVDHTAIPDSLSPIVSASQAIRLTLDEIGRVPIEQDAPEDAIPLVRWLDLPLDDTPALILTGCNEGLIPSSVNSDLFRPNALRRHLGVNDNLQRFARDAYALSVLLHSRKSVTIVAGRRDLRDEPMAPSRLLFAADPEEIARRVERFYGDAEKPLVIAGPFTATRPKSAFTIPRPAPPQSMREPGPLLRVGVTAFGDYLASPYRFYLRHILRLREDRIDVDELDAPAFGNLIHEVLKKFGHDVVRFATDEKEIRRFLEETLEQEAFRTYGDDPYVPIRVQVEQARLRLRAFAAWQADWARQGWTIAHSEVALDRDPVRFDVDGERAIGLVGRIDRIDRHDRDNRWMIFDYKTGESAAPPEKNHRAKGEWFELQLPLYRHLARSLGVTGEVGLGYITLPRDVSAIQALVADWSGADLESADEVARAVGQKILDEEFWQELDAPPGRLTEYGPICQDGVFDREATV